MKDLVYYYWHPNEIPLEADDPENDGIFNGLDFVVLCLQEKQATGRYPDPDEMQKRIRPRLKRDIDHLEQVIERGRPKPDGNILKPGE